MKRKVFSAIVCGAALVGCAPDQAGEAVESLQPGPAETGAGPLVTSPMPSAALDSNRILTRVAFGACLHQNEDHSIFYEIAERDPDLFLFIGDNVYGDVWSRDPDMPELREAYARLAQSESFADFRREVPVLTIWDDHDYGLNDAGGELEFKAASQELFLDVWAAPADDERRTRPGTYFSRTFGQEGRRVQIVGLDTRYFRSELKETDERDARGKERYVPDPDPDKTMLGDAQWSWLAEVLQQPADVRLIFSSQQIIADGHGWEAWRQLPAERDRFYRLLDETDANGVVLFSGDRHAGGLYRIEGVSDYPLTELTSSSLNLPLSAWLDEIDPEDGPYRLGDMYYDENFGVIEIDWDAGAIALELRDKQGALVNGLMIPFAELQVPTAD